MRKHTCVYMNMCLSQEIYILQYSIFIGFHQILVCLLSSILTKVEDARLNVKKKKSAEMHLMR